ncbi:putative ribonuclease H domain, reverse transcriptase zinc-binding domain-containing protein [Arabidopsis thaliana]
MPTYTMSCFKLPNTLCKRIQSALTRFWWDSAADKKKMCWIDWLKMAKTKKEGGLGFKDITNFNDALLAKVSWRILTSPCCLLARILLGKYCRSSSFLDCTVASYSSHGWRSICMGRDLIKSNLDKVIGSGSDTLFWNEPWISLSSPTTPMGPSPELFSGMTVDHLICPVLKTWDREKIRSILPSYEKDILSLRPSNLGARERYAWLLTKSGDYSTKTGYHAAAALAKQGPQPPDPPLEFSWNKEIWNLKCPPKLKFLLWKSMKNALPVGENLRIRNINPLANCPHCGEDESCLHLFFLNKLIFEQKHISSLDLISQSISQAKEWLGAHIQASSSQIVKSWIPPTEIDSDTVKCFTDASWREESLEAGLGWIFVDHWNHTESHHQSAEANINYPLMAESTALLLAIQHASDLGLKKLAIVSDSQQLVKALNGESPPLELHGIIFDISVLSLNFDEISFSFVKRENNFKADALAKAALNPIYSIRFTINENQPFDKKKKKSLQIKSKRELNKSLTQKLIPNILLFVYMEFVL